MKYLIVLITLFFFCSLSFGQKKPFEKAVGMTISLPWINNYSYYDYGNYGPNKIRSVSGFLGIGGSFFYKKGKNKYSLNGGLTSVFLFSFPVGGGSTITAQYLEAIVHHNYYKKLNYIVGLNFSNYYEYEVIEDPTHSFSHNDATIGLTLGQEYQFSRTFSLALFYRPAILSFETKSYRHIISLDARFNINFWKK